MKPGRSLHAGLLAAVLLTIASLSAFALARGAVQPIVAIVSPTGGAALNQHEVSVAVEFAASANPNGRGQGATGNVSLIVLTVEGEEVARHQNGPAVKEGTHVFVVDVSAYPDGPLTLQAHAYQGNERANLVGSSNEIEVLIDRTPPEVMAMADPGPNENSWNNTDVTVTFEATDALSGVANVSGPVVVSDEGAGLTVEGTAVDRAGNSATASVTVNLDKTAPSPRSHIARGRCHPRRASRDGGGPRERQPVGAGEGDVRRDRRRHLGLRLRVRRSAG